MAYYQHVIEALLERGFDSIRGFGVAADVRGFGVAADVRGFGFFGVFIIFGF